MGNSLKLSKQQASSSVYEPLINEKLRVFSFAELKKATNNFREERVVDCEDGSTRIFYKGYINDSRTKTRIAVCVMQECHSSRTLQDWKEEVECLGQISHPNLVRHLGYCCEDGKRFVLVSEYMHKGSLDRHVFSKEDVLPWEMRIKIAIGTTQGLAFYHSVKNISLHEELRMHNILLDEKFNAKLFYLEQNDKYLEETRFGLEYEPPEMFESVTTIGRVEMKSDVYIFGLILLELLTGSKCRRQNVNQNSCFSDNYKIGEIIDP